ncbi:ABC transporter substrate-binding protein [Flavobacterium sp. MFBS3-15]|uniref:ABC transporter substrate-binding protein n=1 Tax=Flavobacterium sp. MFBS3-15 TaxID=2989816 RepID=UPI0022367E18|nr:ABC transporter substrate-binding protein [Flavobacterium sp. MFBS3-15]MCW4467516.1 ABC transporter substrate-binding protein [Flavobacterium sp. MFBS3-15]
MKKILCILFIAVAFTGCKQEPTVLKSASTIVSNSIKHAKGLEIYRYGGYTLVMVTNPWPDSKEVFTYVMQKKKNAVIPDKFKKFPIIQVPLKTIVVTSTTHIPSLEMLGAENTLIGFPDMNFISSEKTRARIDAGMVKEVGKNEQLNTEVLLDLNPDALVGFSISSHNKTMDNLVQSGMKVLYNGDWNEQSPLGKAEWIKFFGALYDQEAKADELFAKIEKEYNDALALAQKAKAKPTVLCGAIYQNQWYMPQGGSWGALFLKDAGADYLWAGSEGTGSLSLSLETVLDRAENADFWIGPSQYTSLKDMTDANPHYTQFKSFKDKQVYSSSNKKGKTGGLIYYELANNRPDLVLKDLIAILHPELLPGYQLQFFERLK